MNLFQQKQTSLDKPGMELNQDKTNLKNHFSAFAITAAKETFLKSSLLEAPQPKPQLTGDLSEDSHPIPLKRLWHDHITTQGRVESVGLRDSITKLNNMRELTIFADPLNQPLLPATLVNSPTVSTTTLLPATLSKPTQSTILVTSTINDQQEQEEVSSKFLDQMLSSTPKGEDKRENYLTSIAEMHHEIPVTPLQVLGVLRGSNLDMILATVDSSAAKIQTNSLQNGASQAVPTVSPEILKNSELSSNFRILIKASTDEDISQSLQVTEEVSTAVSTTSSLGLPVSKNKPLASKSFLKSFLTSSPPFIPSGIHDRGFILWSTSAARADEDFLPRTEMPTAHIPAIYSTPVVTTRNLHPKHLAKGSTMVNKELLEPHRLLVGQIDGELHDISGSGKIGTASSSLLTLKNRTPMISNHDQENATAKQSVVNQTLDSTAKHNVTVTTSAFPVTSGFPVFHSSKRRPVCPYPPLPAHGTFYFHTIPNPAPFQYKHYIQYACYAGYTLANGDVYSYCVQDGQWSGVTPMCIGKPLLLQKLLW